MSLQRGTQVGLPMPPRREGIHYCIRVCLSSIQDRNLIHVEFVVDLSQNDLECNQFGVFESNLFVEPKEKATSSLHTTSGVLCWMNERYAHIQ